MRFLNGLLVFVAFNGLILSVLGTLVSLFGDNEGFLWWAAAALGFWVMLHLLDLDAGQKGPMP